MNPDNIVGPKNFVKFIREMLIDPHVSTQVATREFCEVQTIMKNRPQHTIGKTVVEFLVIGFGDVGNNVFDISVGTDASIARSLGHLTAPAEPQALLAPQRSANTNFKTSGPLAMTARCRDTI